MYINSDTMLRIKDSGFFCSNMLSDKEYSMLPNTELIMNNTFWVGIHPGLNKENLTKTSNLIHKFIEDNK